jgi:deoxyribodipyrimidine photo-lyase
MVQVVWFKRDLRVHDHRPLTAAVARGPVLPLYIVEPEIWTAPDASRRQWEFTREAIVSLADALARRGARLVIRVGDPVAVLAALHAETPITHLNAHEETGNALTFARDRAVRAFARRAGILVDEMPQFGVVRGLRARDGWAERWDRFMAEPVTPAPKRISMAPIGDVGALPTADDLDLAPDPCPGRQIGGRTEAVALLKSFLEGRARGYQWRMSSPATAWESCSRLSSHLAVGAISLREVVQATARRIEALRAMPPEARPVELSALKAFLSRLHWHCHFIQKLESEPAIEFRPFHSAFQGTRTDGLESPFMQAFEAGETGFPFVDACMRSLKATGWINFRMRAMLTAFASYHLWLDWRATGTVLARLFVDYEPGIHWSQIQMQSGTTAINTLRIYNPVKQSRDQDPDGHFIRTHVPELARLPTEWIHEPWSAPPAVLAAAGVRIGVSYPAPIVDHVAAARIAKARITEIRRGDGFRTEQKRVLETHGSRRSDPRDRMWTPEKGETNQLDLGL